MGLISQAHDRKLQLPPKLFQIFATDLAQLDVLQIVPNSLIRIQIRSVGWEGL